MKTTFARISRRLLPLALLLGAVFSCKTLDEKPARIIVAAFLGEVRLIDNLAITL